MARKPCIIKSQFGVEKEIPVFWYEIKNSEGTDFMKADLSYSIASTTQLELPAEAIESIPLSMVAYDERGNSFVSFPSNIKSVV